MRYRPDIDGLRAISVLGVLVYHLDNAWLPGGFTGVDVFFVISGFVVTGAMDVRANGRFFGFIADFYARRLARIIPALVPTLVMATLLDVLFMPASWLSNQDEALGLAAFLGVSNSILQKGREIYFAQSLDYNPYLHTWLLGVEEQFNFLALVLLFFALKASRAGVRLGGTFLLQKKGLQVILWEPTPLFKAPTFRCSDWFNRQNPICEGGPEMPREELEAMRGPILSQMHQLEGPGSTIFDAFSTLCPEPICRVKAPNGRPLFFDGDHLSRYGNEVIYPTFKSLLGRLGVQPEPLKSGTN